MPSDSGNDRARAVACDAGRPSRAADAVAVESVAGVRIAGRSTFRMNAEYENVSDQRVWSPQPHPAPMR